MNVVNDLKDLVDKINEDGGYGSRKFNIAIIAMFLILLAAVIAGNWPVFSPQYGTAVWGIVSITLGYTGGNVAARYVTGKTVGSIITPTVAATQPAAATTPVAAPPVAVVVEAPAPPAPPAPPGQPQ